jgi:hypothetical protein
VLFLPSALLIVGTDRNAGKTTLASLVIERFAPVLPITAVKISPHFHELGPAEQVAASTDQFVIVKETRPGSLKDSSRFLRAGASEVYYMQVWDQDLSAAFKELLKICGTEKPLIIESGWLRNIVDPGLFIIVNKKGNQIYKESIGSYRKFTHLWMEADGKDFSPGIESIVWKEGRWDHI